MSVFSYVRRKTEPAGGSGERGSKRWQVGTLVYTSAGLMALFFWLLGGDFAVYMKERAVYAVAQIVLRNFEASDWIVGLLVGSIPAAIGMFFGPVISVISDRHRSRLGRRIPFLIFSTPIISLSMIALAFASPMGQALHQVLAQHSPGESGCRIIVFGFFWTIFEVATVTVNTLFLALINDVVPQRIIGRFFALFRAVSLLAGVLFNFFLMGHAKEQAPWIFAGLSVLFFVGFALMCFKVKEGEYEVPKQEPCATLRTRIVSPVVSYIRECFSKPFYLWIFLAATLGLVSMAPVNTFSVFHGRSLGMSDDLYGKCLAMCYTVSFLLAYPLGALADRIHPIRLAITIMVLYAAAMLSGYFLATSAVSFFVVFSLHVIISGAYLTGTASIMQRLFPPARFAQFASAAQLTAAVFMMIIPPAVGVLVESMNRNYQIVFILGSVLAAVSAAAYVMVLIVFIRHGGDRAYTPPQ